MKRTILSIALALCVGCVFGQSKEFKSLADIEGVESIHIGKFLLNLAAKNNKGELDLGKGVFFNVKDGNLLKKIDDIRIYSTEDEDAVSPMSTRVKNVLKSKGWEPLIEMTEEDGQKAKIYQAKKGKRCTIAIFAEEDDEAWMRQLAEGIKSGVIRSKSGEGYFVLKGEGPVLRVFLLMLLVSLALVCRWLMERHRFRSAEEEIDQLKDDLRRLTLLFAEEKKKNNNK